MSVRKLSTVAAEAILTRAEYSAMFARHMATGLLNNLSFTLVICGAQDISRLFNMTDFMPLFTTMVFFASFIAAALHARLATGYTFRQRIVFGMVLQTFAYILLGSAFFFEGTAPLVGFAMAQAATFLVGVFQTIGEVNNLAMLHCFPNSLVGAWGFGCGLSQLVGSVVYIAALNAGVPHHVFFFCLIPIYVLYWRLFVQIDTIRAQLEEDKNHSAVEAPLLGGQPKKNVHLTPDTLKSVLRFATCAIINMCVTYGLNFLTESGFADRATLHPEPLTETIAVNAYTLAVMSYGVGMTFGRLSVVWMATTRITLLTIIQVVNTALWGFEAYFQVIRSTMGVSGWWFYQVWMIYVGIIAGMSYANCLAIIGKTDKIPNHYRELAVNIGFMFSNTCVVIATLTSIALNNTIMSEQQLFPH